MVWVRSPVYFYNRNGTYYFSRAVPSDLRHRFPKRKIEVSLRTKSESKAARSAAALSDRLERYWDSLRMEMIYSKELGLTVLPEATTSTSDSFSLTDALALYHRSACDNTYDRKLSRQCLSSSPPAINSRSICRSSLRISRALAAFSRRFSSLSLVNFP